MPLDLGPNIRIIRSEIRHITSKHSASDMSFRSVHMSEGMFSDVVTHAIFVVVCFCVWFGGFICGVCFVVLFVCFDFFFSVSFFSVPQENCTS